MKAILAICMLFSLAACKENQQVECKKGDAWKWSKAEQMFMPNDCKESIEATGLKVKP